MGCASSTLVVQEPTEKPLSTTGPKKITIAAGVDAVLVAALISEWDANRFKNKD